MNPKDFQEKIRDYAEQYRDWKKLDLAVQEFTEEDQIQSADPMEMIHAFLVQEYEAYLNATQEECEAIRASFSINRDFEDLLLHYVYSAAEKLRSTTDVKWLERGLVAASLENSGRDYRDTLLSLNDLYRAAQDVGIDPNPYFQKAASLASQKKPRGGSTPLSILLAGYTSHSPHVQRGDFIA